ncbi:potassium channel family protein [Lignipirellula cremea]|uniref:Inner membrane protein YbaL n=1 Tax=Lignipirellula cremea TaxID=2528010 RepID=A0A518DWU2_9BACT|nr:potassium channel protein [Lignipirellula cremea]QDU96303.1 Inner membrane protein YbaL [Lignipirellula cremea]
MRPLQRIRTGAIFFAVVLTTAIIGYRLFGYDWVESVWMVAVTISSVGYGERSQNSHAFQIFTVAVIVFGMTAAAYTFGGFLQLITEGQIQQALGRRRMTREIDQLHNHVIICGFGLNGQLLSESLYRQKRAFVVIDHEAHLVAEARESGYLSVIGDATEEEVLLEAGVRRAKSLVTALPNDALNVFITLTTRNLSPNIQIIARADQKSTEKKLRQAGANKVVAPAVISARQMVRMITRPSTADLMDIMAESSIIEYDLDEIEVLPDCGLIDITVRETEANRRHRLLVVAVKQADGNMLLNPDASFQFKVGDVLILMGRGEDVQGFRNMYRV